MDVYIQTAVGNNVTVFEAGQPVSGSSLRAFFEGGAGLTQIDDFRATLSGSFSNNSRLDYTAQLREGDDRFDAKVLVSGFDALSGSEVRLRADGGQGRDLLALSDGAVGGVATVDGLFEGVLRGGPANDTLSIDWLGLNGSGTFRARENGGLQSDAVFLGLLTDASSNNPLDLAVQGQKGLDTVYVAVFDLGAGGFAPLGSALADGGLDTDTCLVTGDASDARVNCEK
jgi:hypothetical protein